MDPYQCEPTTTNPLLSSTLLRSSFSDEDESTTRLVANVKNLLDNSLPLLLSPPNFSLYQQTPANQIASPISPVFHQNTSNNTTTTNIENDPPISNRHNDDIYNCDDQNPPPDNRDIKVFSLLSNTVGTVDLKPKRALTQKQKDTREEKIRLGMVPRGRGVPATCMTQKIGAPLGVITKMVFLKKCMT